MTYKFPDSCKNWQTTDFDTLYKSKPSVLNHCIVNLEKIPIENNENVVKHVQ